MNYKLYLILSLALVDLVVATGKDEEKLKIRLINAVESIRYEDYNSVMWLNRMLTERERWDFWHLPDDVEESEGDFVRGLTAYGSSLFRAEVLRHWSFGTETEANVNERSEYAYRINQSIVQPCREVVNHLAEATAPFKQSELEGYPIKLSGLPEIWLNTEKACQRILADPKHWIDLSYETAEKNYLL